MHRSLDGLERWAIRFTRIVAFLGLLALMALSTVILVNAAMRWLFATPIDGVRDWEKLIVAIAVGCCLPAVMAARQNISIRFVGRLLGGRAEVALELFGALVVLVILAVLSWELQHYVWEVSARGQTTESLGMPIGPWWQVVAILFMLSTLVQLVVVASLVAALLRGRRLADVQLGETAPENPVAGRGQDGAAR